MTYMPQLFMAKADHPEKYNWWLNELNSPGYQHIAEKLTEGLMARFAILSS